MANNRGGLSQREFDAKKKGGTLNYSTGKVSIPKPIAPKMVVPRAAAKQTPAAKIMTAQKSQFETLKGGAQGPVVPKGFVSPTKSVLPKLDAVKSYKPTQADLTRTAPTAKPTYIDKLKSQANIVKSSVKNFFTPKEEKTQVFRVGEGVSEEKNIMLTGSPRKKDVVSLRDIAENNTQGRVSTTEERKVNVPTVQTRKVSPAGKAFETYQRTAREVLNPMDDPDAYDKQTEISKKRATLRKRLDSGEITEEEWGKLDTPFLKESFMGPNSQVSGSMGFLGMGVGKPLSAAVGRITNRAGLAGVGPKGIGKLIAAGEKGAFTPIKPMASNRFGINTARAVEGEVAGATDTIPQSVPRIASEIAPETRVARMADNVSQVDNLAPARQAMREGANADEVVRRIPQVQRGNHGRRNEIFTETDDIGKERVFTNVDDGGRELKRVEVGEIDETGNFVEKMSEDGRPMSTVIEEGAKNLREGKRGLTKLDAPSGTVRTPDGKRGKIGLKGVQSRMSAAKDAKNAKIAEDANIQDHIKSKIEKLKQAVQNAKSPDARMRLEQQLNDEVSILRDYPKMSSEDRQFFKERSLRENKNLSDAIYRDYDETRSFSAPAVAETAPKKGIFGGTLKGFVKNPLAKDPLLQEAGKTYYHQSQSVKPFSDFLQKGDTGYKKAYYSQANEGIYFSPNKDLVKSKYGKNGGTLIEASINPKNSLDLGTADAMYFDGRKVNYGDVVNENVKRELQGLKPVPEPDIILTGISKKAKAWLQKNGYDAVEGMKGEMWSAPELVALDKSIIKTKSPDLYNKAQGGVPKGKLRTLKGFAGGDAPKTGFDPQSYVKEMVKKQKDAQGKTGLLSKVGSFLGEFKKKIIETNAPIEDVIAESQKKFKFEAIPRYDMTNQIDRVYRSQSMAGQFAKENGLEDVINKVDDLDEFDQYLIAKHGKSLDAQGIKTGRDAEKDALFIQSVGDKYVKQEKVVRDYSHKLLDYAVETGLISRKVADDLVTKYPDYVPYQRIFGEDEAVTSGFGGKGVANLGKQSVVQRIKGSEREVQSPMQSFLEKTTDAFAQGEKNKAAQILTSHHNIPGNPFGLEQLRSAENVEKRIETLTELRTLYKGVLDESGKTIEAGIHKQRRQLMYANRELRGILRSAEDVDKQIAPLLDEAITRSADFDAKSKIDPIVSKLKTLEGRKNNLTQKAFFGKEAERAKELDTILAEKKQLVQELRDELKQVRDIPKTPGDNTITLFKNGIKEVWKVNKDVAEAAKAMNVQQIGLLGKIFAFPVRAAKVGITGINLPFVAANIAKDIVSAFVNSKESFRALTTMPRALFEAVGHQKLYQEMVKEGAMQTSFDIARNQVSPTIRNTRGLLGNKGMERVKYVADTPAKLFRAVEDIVGRSEEFNRISQYKAAYDASIKRGMKPIDARAVAARAARETTTNFARKGEWGGAMNVLVLYLNAGIQGNRTLVRNITTRPVATATKIATVVGMPLAITTAWNLNDPKRKAAYEDIPEFEKENNFILIPDNPQKDANGKWDVIKVPITPGLSNMVQPIRYALERANGMDPQSFAQIANVLSGSVSPVQVPVDEDTTRKTLSQLTPQAIKPTIEAQTNKDSFTGAPIIPRKLEGLAPELQVKDNTSGTAKLLGKQLNASPLQVEHFVKSTFGSVGLQILNASDKTLVATGKLSPEDVGGQEVLDAIFARFGKASGNAIQNKEWEMEAQASQEEKSKKYVEKQTFMPTYEKIQELRTSNPDEAQAMLDGMTDDEYKQYKTISKSEKAKTSKKFHDTLDFNPKKAVEYVRSLPEYEQQRLLDNMTDEEYEKYESGK